MNLKRIIKLFGINLYPKDFYYDDLRSRYEDLSGYSSIVKFLDISPCINSETSYVMANGALPILKSVIRKNQLAFTEYFHTDFKNLRIYLFRDLIGGLKVRKEMHFVGQETFLIKYSFPYMTRAQKEAFLCKALSKYECKKDFVFDSFQIKCSDNYSVFFNDSVEFEIYHINNNSGFFVVLEKYLAERLLVREKHMGIDSGIPAYI
jgi:hypothetical protein